MSSSINIFNKNVVIPLAFTSSNWNASCQISVQFPVGEIIIRGISYQDSANGFNDLNSCSLLYSDLVQNQCLGIVSMGTVNNTTASHLPFNNLMRFCYKTPQNCNGNYTFQLKDFTSPVGATFSGTYSDLSKYQLVLILEFIQYQTPILPTDI